MNNLTLYRRRLIPNECIWLKDDTITHLDPEKNCIVTTWQALKPKKDLHHGASAFFCEEGFKLSKFCDKEDNLLYYYIDIMDCEWDYKGASLPFHEGSSFTTIDLLADVIIYPDGFVKTVDIGEMRDAYEEGLLDLTALLDGIKKLDHVLELVYSKEIDEYIAFLEQHM